MFGMLLCRGKYVILYPEKANITKHMTQTSTELISKSDFAIARIEAYTESVMRSIVTFSLYLPPKAELERYLNWISTDEDAVYVLNRLHGVWVYAFSPKELSDPMLGQQRKVIGSEIDNVLESIFRQPKPVTSYYPWLNSPQLFGFLNTRHKPEFNGLIKLYKDYLTCEITPIVKSWAERLNIRIGEDFSPYRKLDSSLTPDQIIHVTDYLVEKECIGSEAKNTFVSLFENILINQELSLPIKWNAKTSTSSSGHPKTNEFLLRKVLEFMGVDFSDSAQNSIVKNCFRGRSGEGLELKPREESQAVKNFLSDLKQYIDSFEPKKDDPNE